MPGVEQARRGPTANYNGMLRRSWILVALALVAAAVPARALTVDTGREAPVRARIEVTGWPDNRVVVPAHLPAPTTGAGIGPGSLIFTTIPGEGSFICTANWVWASGSTRYLGAAGHCFLPPDKKATHGAGADYNASGVVTQVCLSGCATGGSLSGLFGTFVNLGAVKYARQTGPGGDLGNDFGIVEVPTGLHANLRPALPMWGNAVGTGTLFTGNVTCHYGNGIGVGEVYPTKGRLGVGIASDANRWFAAIPSAPGDSGSAVATCSTDSGGVHAVNAIGVLTHISSGGITGTTMSRAVAMASEAGITLAPVF